MRKFSILKIDHLYFTCKEGGVVKMNVESQSEHLKQSKNWYQSLPTEWQNWLNENIENGCDVQKISLILQSHGLSPRVDQYLFSEDEQLSEQLQNELLDYSLEGLETVEILEKIKQKNISNHLIIQFLKHVNNNVIFKKLKQLQQQQNKQRWLLQVMGQLNQLNDHISSTIDCIETPDFATFLEQYYSQMRPVILKGGIQHWPALHKWSPKYFAQHFENELVEVQMHREQYQDFEKKSVQLKRIILMQDFVAQIKATKRSNDIYLTANNAAQNKQFMQKISEDLGDFAKGYCQKEIKDRHFLWFGPAGTFTPLHYDLTNNMLAQIYGRKKVTLIPAWQMPYMYNDHWVFSQVSDVAKADLVAYPLLENVTPFECILQPGETLFIPIGWWHSVESLDMSISVSFTHFNVNNHFFTEYPQDLIR